MNWSDIFMYNPETGILQWKIKPYKGRVNIGDIAGNDNVKGHLRVKYKNKTMFVHRIIYEMHYGAVPHGMQIDHKNGNKSDNRLSNIRLATAAQNSQNIKKPLRNTSGCVGVDFNKSSGKWMARISKQMNRIVIGYFDTKEEAYAARVAAEKEYHGDFAQSLCRSS